MVTYICWLGENAQSNENFIGVYPIVNTSSTMTVTILRVLVGFRNVVFIAYVGVSQ